MNAFHHLRESPAAENRGVVRFNFDILHSPAWFDLAPEPVIVTMPDTAGRYYLLPMLDMWTDAFATPGTCTTGGRRRPERPSVHRQGSYGGRRRHRDPGANSRTGGGVPSPRGEAMADCYPPSTIVITVTMIPIRAVRSPEDRREMGSPSNARVTPTAKRRRIPRRLEARSAVSTSPTR